jgi:hypothetical protein
VIPFSFGLQIYGYRVDDVYLTSHKVLANLNRNDCTAGGKGGGAGINDPDAGEGAEFGDDDDRDENRGAAGRGRNRRKQAAKAAGPTLEGNVGTYRPSPRYFVRSGLRSCPTRYRSCTS